MSSFAPSSSSISSFSISILSSSRTVTGPTRTFIPAGLGVEPPEGGVSEVVSLVGILKVVSCAVVPWIEIVLEVVSWDVVPWVGVIEAVSWTVVSSVEIGGRVGVVVGVGLGVASSVSNKEGAGAGAGVVTEDETSEASPVPVTGVLVLEDESDEVPLEDCAPPCEED